MTSSFLPTDSVLKSRFARTLAVPALALLLGLTLRRRSRRP